MPDNNDNNNEETKQIPQTGRRKKLLVNLLPLLAVVLLAVIAAVAAMNQPPAAVDEDMVIISVDGREYDRVPLSAPRTVTVTQKAEDGTEMVNVIEVSDHGAVMASSTCGNQLCVHMGEVTVTNWEFRANQQFIICLPNRVSVELVVIEE